MSRTIRLLTVLTALALAGVAQLGAAEPITGLWNSIADDGTTIESLVYIYTWQGQVYGRLLATYEDGIIKDSIMAPTDKADKLKGDPFYAGLDYVYQMKDKGGNWQGLIMDPRTGDEYDCIITRKTDTLIVRGQLKGLFGGLLGRDQTWKLATAAALPPGAAMPDASGWIPVVPKKK